MERKRKMGKTEIKCRETEGTARRKKDDRLDDTTAVPSSTGSSFSLFIPLFFFLTIFVFIVAVAFTCDTCRSLLNYSGRVFEIFFSALEALHSPFYALTEEIDNFYHV